MNLMKTSVPPINWRKGAALGIAAIGCFHLAYLPIRLSAFQIFSIVHLILLIQLVRLASRRQAFYTALGVSLLCVAPQLHWFWNIFGAAAVPLWLVVSFWTALFVLLAHRVLRRFGPAWALLLIPFLWTGIEYFRSELYFLKFSWVNVGYPAATHPLLPSHWIGMYGIGFLGALAGAMVLTLRRNVVLGSAGLAVFLAVVLAPAANHIKTGTSVRIAGIQMEFPNENQILKALDRLLAEKPETELIVLSEYTLDGPVPFSLKEWCRTHHRHLIVGGKDPAAGNNFYDTAFVIDAQGEIVFKQAKSVPIQFFKDGLPARRQELWNSPWGRMGICVCYDLSYTRVTDRLINLGAQMLIVPTMDLVNWGKRQHELHAMVAPVRAEEYGIPVFRLASSGISQAVDAHGIVAASAGFPGEGEILYAELRTSRAGSLPVDRTVAPASVAITALAVLALTIALIREKCSNRGSMTSRPDQTVAACVR